MRPNAAARLSPRELEVARWLGEGKTLEETGIILGMSARTAAKHRDNIYGKLDVSNRVQFLLRCFFKLVTALELAGESGAELLDWMA